MTVQQKIKTTTGIVLGAAAVLMLTLDFNISSHRWLGVGTHLAVGALGVIGCAKWMATEKDG